MSDYNVEHVGWLRSQSILRHRIGDYVGRDIFYNIARELEEMRNKVTLVSDEQARILSGLHLGRKTAELERDKMQQYFDDLRDLCGYIENGTDTSITIGQDDATKDWFLRIKGGKDIVLFSTTFIGLIKQAHTYSKKLKENEQRMQS